MFLRCLILLLLFSGLAQAAPHGAQQLSYEEFSALAHDLSGRVNLFREVWKNDPEAEFYGGTSRDYLYWLKRKFTDVKTREEALTKANELRKLQAIDARDFVIGESDVDLVTNQPVRVTAEQFGLRRIDGHGPDVFDLSTPAGRSELDQGYIPAEKIRMNAKGLVKADQFGDGAKEIYSGRITLHAPDPKKFAETIYAKSKENHPILIALRFLRLQAMNYFNDHGVGFPDKAALLDIDQASADFTRKTIAQALNGTELNPYLEKPRFKKFLNAVTQKMFRSYTNPTAAMELAKEFGADRLPLAYEGVEPLNQYLFAQHRDPAKIKKNLKDFRVDEKKFFGAVEKHFPDGFLYHGTRTEQAFRSILLQGILPSSDGSAGEGLYGVGAANKRFSEEWSGEKDRLVKFHVSPTAKIVDIRGGEGKRVFNEFNNDFSAFAEAFGVDILNYPYNVEAYAVKNSAVLERPAGVYREVLTLSRAMQMAQNARDPQELKKLSAGVKLSAFSAAETEMVMAEAERAGAFERYKRLPDFSKLLELLKREEHIPIEGGDPVFLKVVHDFMRREIYPSRDPAKIFGFAHAIDAYVPKQKNIFILPELSEAVESWRRAGVFLQEVSSLQGLPEDALAHKSILHQTDNVLNKFIHRETNLAAIRGRALRVKSAADLEKFLEVYSPAFYVHGHWNPPNFQSEAAKEIAEEWSVRGLLPKVPPPLKEMPEKISAMSFAVHPEKPLHAAVVEKIILNAIDEEMDKVFDLTGLQKFLRRIGRISAEEYSFRRAMEVWEKHGVLEKLRAPSKSMSELLEKIRVLHFVVPSIEGEGAVDDNLWSRKLSDFFSEDVLSGAKDLISAPAAEKKMADLLGKPANERTPAETMETLVALATRKSDNPKERFGLVSLLVQEFDYPGSVRRQDVLDYGPKNHARLFPVWSSFDVAAENPRVNEIVLRALRPFTAEDSMRYYSWKEAEVPNAKNAELIFRHDTQNVAKKLLFWEELLAEAKTQDEFWDLFLGRFWPQSAFATLHYNYGATVPQKSLALPDRAFNRILDASTYDWFIQDGRSENEKILAFFSGLLRDERLAKHPNAPRFLHDLMRVGDGRGTPSISIDGGIRREGALVACDNLVAKYPGVAGEVMDALALDHRAFDSEKFQEMIQREPWLSHPRRRDWLEKGRLSGPERFYDTLLKADKNRWLGQSRGVGMSGRIKAWNNKVLGRKVPSGGCAAWFDGLKAWHNPLLRLR